MSFSALAKLPSRFFRFKKIFVLFASLVLFQDGSFSQMTDDLSDVKVEELTDDQMRTFIDELSRLGIKDERIEQLALERGMSPVEVVKLKERLQVTRKMLTAASYPFQEKQNSGSSKNIVQDSISGAEQKPLADFRDIFTGLKTKNFGSDVFTNPSITFAPALNLPTPANYQLAADDELQIDVSGYSEANYRLKVSPEGTIRIPVAGPVSVNGLTIEQARKIIKRKLATTIYADINTGNTSVDVTLASIRSIKVTIIGEATIPGTYTLPSLASAYNALYACGGPNYQGSFRNIEVIRNNGVAAVIDVYDFLVRGNKKDIILKDQDVIKINPYSVRVELKGEIKKPGLYDVAPGENLGTILSYAGGFTDNAYTARIQVYKNTSRDRQVSTITEEQTGTVVPQRGDTYIIGKILNRFTNRISIKGAIYRPGEYELKSGMMLTQLINEADGIREDVFTGRAVIHRLKEDLSPEIISFNVQQLLSGSIPDIQLRKEDRVEIYSKFDLKEGYYITIEGEVSAPGTFLYEEGITIQDVILMAGGLKEAASPKRIEVSRRIKNADSLSPATKTSVIYQQDISPSLTDSTGLPSFVLLPFDELVIRAAPGYFIQKNAVIEGEVLYGGKYTLETKSERISDLVKRSGGLTLQAYPEGAVLVRTRNFTKTEKNNSELGLGTLLKQNYSAGTAVPLLQNQLNEAVSKRSENVGIDLRRILANPGSEYDLLLNDGDTLRIPKQLQTVRVNGEVLHPALIRYDKEISFRGYVNGAGGFNDKASRKRSYVVYANGSAKGTKSFLFFKNYPSLKPGAEIYVPTKRERERLRTGEIVTLGATLVSMLAILINVLGK